MTTPSPVMKLTDCFGFFCDTFRILHNYLLCQREKTTFIFDDSVWTFYGTGGWKDYFSTLHECIQSVPSAELEMRQIDPDFTAEEYREGMLALFKLQPWLEERVQRVMKDLNLVSKRYAAIFIRRGDKIVQESVYVRTRIYVEELVKHYPEVETIFVQTDDYRAYEEIKSLLPPEIRVVTTCPPTKLGAFVFEFQPEEGTKVPCELNKQYLESFANLPPHKVIADYSPEEIREHVAEMLVGCELCKRGVGVALDLLSNTGRYIAFTHESGREAVWNIEKHIEFKMDKKILCPRFFPF